MQTLRNVVDAQLSEQDYFIIWATELYRATKGLSGPKVDELFAKYDIYDLLRDKYFLYHIESSDNFIAEIDQRLAGH
jgi:hypothetical protein